MPPKKHLAAVPDGTPAKAKVEFENISEALSGSSRDVHNAMRKALAKQLDDGKISSNAIGSAYKELRELDRLIRLADHEQRQGEETESGDVDDSFDASAV